LASARAGEKRKGSSAAPGRAFFGFFLCTSKERNPPAVRGTAITTRPQAAQMKSRPKGGFVVQDLDARLRGHDGINKFRFRGNDNLFSRESSDRTED